MTRLLISKNDKRLLYRKKILWRKPTKTLKKKTRFSKISKKKIKTSLRILNYLKKQKFSITGPKNIMIIVYTVHFIISKKHTHQALNY